MILKQSACAWSSSRSTWWRRCAAAPPRHPAARGGAQQRGPGTRAPAAAGGPPRPDRASAPSRPARPAARLGRARPLFVAIGHKTENKPQTIVAEHLIAAQEDEGFEGSFSAFLDSLDAAPLTPRERAALIEVTAAARADEGRAAEEEGEEAEEGEALGFADE